MADSGVCICPRCGGAITGDVVTGSGTASLDATRDGPICSPCAWHEAWLHASGQALPEQWPVQVPERFFRIPGSC